MKITKIITIFIFTLIFLFFAKFVLLDDSLKIKSNDSLFSSLPTNFYKQEYNTFSKYDSILRDINDIVAVTQNNLVAVGRGGVIISSKDGGDIWKNIKSPTTRALNSIVALTQNNLVAVGGGVIISSKDGGNTWQQIKSPATSWLNSIVALTQNNLVAVGDGGVIIYSKDGGASWGKINSPIKYGWLSSIVALTQNNLVAVGDGGVIISSKDGGNTWQQIKSPATSWLNSIVALTQNNLVAVGDGGVIIYSKDGGDTWQQIKSPNINWLNSIVALTQNNLVAVGLGGSIISSKDGGGTWKNIKFPTTRALISIVAITQNNLVAVGLSGTIISSKDGGDTWELVKSYATSSTSSIVALTQNNLVAVGGGGVIISSKDGGDTWKNIKSPTTSPLYSIVNLTQNNLVAVGGGVIISSKDDGDTWQQIKSPATSWLNSIVALTQNNLVAVGGGGVIISSKNGGDTWQQIKSPTTSSLKSIVKLTQNNLVAVGGGGVIISSKNGGDTWEKIKSPTTRGLRSIVALTQNNLVAVGGGGTIISSKDGGDTWKNIKSPTTREFRSIVALTQNNLVAVGLGGSVIYSKDGGDTWELVKYEYDIDFTSIIKADDKIFIGAQNNNILKFNLDNEKIEQIPYFYKYGFLTYLILISMSAISAISVYFLAKEAVKQDSINSGDVQSDKAIQNISQDKYGYSVLSQSIVTLLSSYQTKTPLCVGIDGAWGSGKSSVVYTSSSLLDDCGIKNFVFNVWHYQNEKNLLSALMRAFLNSLVPNVFSVSNLFFRAKLFYHRVLKKPDNIFYFLLMFVVMYFIHRVLWIESFYEVNNYIVLLVDVLFASVAINKVFRAFSSNISWFIKSYKSIFSLKNFDKDIGLRDEFKKELEILIQSTSNKTVLFIDDLDRCMDKDVLAIMQTVNYLSSIENLYIVMAVDKGKIIEAITREYDRKNNAVEHQERAKKYIEKIFQITINIPKFDGKFVKNKIFKLSNLEKRIYTSFDYIRRFKKFILNYSMILLLGLFIWFIFPSIKSWHDNWLIVAKTTISDFVKKINKTTSQKPIQAKPTLDTNDDKKNISTPNIRNKETPTNIEIKEFSKITNSKSVIFPASKEKISLWKEMIPKAGWLSMVLFAFLLFAVGAFYTIPKIRKKLKQQDDFIWQQAHENTTTPREAKLIYNKIRAIVLISRKNFEGRHNAFELYTHGVLGFILKIFVFLYFSICYSLKIVKFYFLKKKHLHSLKTIRLSLKKKYPRRYTKKYFNELFSMIRGVSKTKAKDDEDFKEEVSIISEILTKGKKIEECSDELQSKLEIISINKNK